MDGFRRSFLIAEERRDSKGIIEEHRAAIDDIDEQIVELLNQRARHAHVIQIHKPAEQMALFDPQREEEVCIHLEECNEGPLYNEQLRYIYAAILKVMKELRV
ncbi:MAG: chorismate mutase [Coriobacteriales bacterium]|nr:chorismate mutase [Coriobacteriales bacterium]MBQ6585960.1 chorismate mutase [Coriobacteriales bacterium]